VSAANRKRTTSPKLSETAKGRLRRGRKKVCAVCADQISHVDYKDTALLRRFMSDRGKIKSRANTGTCVQHQSDVAIAIKNAREMALLPYVVRTLSGDRGGRRGRGPGAGRPRDQASAPSPEGPSSGPSPAPASTEGAISDTDDLAIAPVGAGEDETAMALEGATAGQPED
jgi:small subunit ribosomal protein S18